MIIELDFEHQARNYKEMYFNEVNSEITRKGKWEIFWEKGNHRKFTAKGRLHKSNRIKLP